jgi:hypothetical protein
MKRHAGLGLTCRVTDAVGANARAVNMTDPSLVAAAQQVLSVVRRHLMMNLACRRQQELNAYDTICHEYLTGGAVHHVVSASGLHQGCKIQRVSGAHSPRAVLVVLLRQQSS